MSTEELTVLAAPVIPNGVYRFKFGSSVGVGGRYLTAGRPGSQATAAARPTPGHIQRFHVTYNAHTGSYLLKTDLQHGLSYLQPKPGQAIITSKTGPPREFKITKVTIPVATGEASSLPPIRPNLYIVGVGGGSTRAMSIGLAPPTIEPPLLQLQYASKNNVWQIMKSIPSLDGEEEEEEEEEFSDEYDE